MALQDHPATERRSRQDKEARPGAVNLQLLIARWARFIDEVWRRQNFQRAIALAYWHPQLEDVVDTPAIHVYARVVQQVKVVVNDTPGRIETDPHEPFS